MESYSSSSPPRVAPEPVDWVGEGGIVMTGVSDTVGAPVLDTLTLAVCSGIVVVVTGVMIGVDEGVVEIETEDTGGGGIEVSVVQVGTTETETFGVGVGVGCFSGVCFGEGVGVGILTSAGLGGDCFGDRGGVGILSSGIGEGE